MTMNSTLGHVSLVSMLTRHSPVVEKSLHKKQEERWNDHVKSLTAYKEKHGHCNPVRSSSALSRWVYAIRQRNHEGLLPDHRVKQLENMGFKFDPRPQKWEEKFSSFVEFKQKAKGGYSLESLKRHSKTLYEWHLGINNALLDPKYANRPEWVERRSRLEHVGFKFSNAVKSGLRADIQVVSFNDRLTQLLACPKTKNGSPIVEDKKLLLWLSHQREAVRKHKLEPERVHALHKAGVDFYPNRRDEEYSWLITAAKAKQANPLMDVALTTAIIRNVQRSLKRFNQQSPGSPS